MNTTKKIVITGFMGVGKSSVARHLSHLMGCDRVDLDSLIELDQRRKVPAIIAESGEAQYRRIETDVLRKLLSGDSPQVISLGGGTWTVSENRRLIRENLYTAVWLESSFEHCWMNIRRSKKERPLAANKEAAKKLFDARQKLYCLADWHFVVRPEYTSYDVAKKIFEEIFV